jgi:predicted N-formylglutamate amidohydrolase
MHLDGGSRLQRVDEVYRPFQAGLASLIHKRLEVNQPPILVTVHSYTPVYFGEHREVEVGILHDSDTRFANRMLLSAEAAGTYKTLRNRPYGPADGVMHTLTEHGQSAELLNVMIEIRNDLIAQSDGQDAISDFLAGLIRQSLPSGASADL